MEWVYLLALAQEGASVGCDFRSGETLVNILWAGKHCERLCGDLLAVHQRKCTFGKIEIFSRLASDEITNIWVKLCNLCRA
jgi:hypothetical protein